MIVNHINTYKQTMTSNPNSVNPSPVIAAVKGHEHYSFFKLKTAKLVLNANGKQVVFKRGEPLGWRFSNDGKKVRLISPLLGATKVFSLPADDRVMKWLDTQNPAKKIPGSLKSDAPEHANNPMVGYVVKDGQYFYRDGIDHIQRSGILQEKYIFPNKTSADKVRKGIEKDYPRLRLKLAEIYRRDKQNKIQASSEEFNDN